MTQSGAFHSALYSFSLVSMGFVPVSYLTVTLRNCIEVSIGGVKHDIREPCGVVNTVFGAIGLMLSRRELSNTLKPNLKGNSFFSKADCLQILSETASSFSLQYKKGRKF